MQSKRDDNLRHGDGECDRKRLAAFAADALGALDREQMLIHLADCGECRNALALIAPDEGPPTSAVLSKKAA